MEDLVAKAKKVIEENSFMVLGTTDGQSPWVSPVFYATDVDYTFYWHSSPDTRHSQFLKKNSHVAVVIFNSTNPDIPGVYLDGEAYEVEREDVAKGLQILFTKAVADVTKREALINSADDFSGQGKLRLYKFIPKKIYINDSEKWNGKWVDWHREVPLLKK